MHQRFFYEVIFAISWRFCKRICFSKGLLATSLRQLLLVSLLLKPTKNWRFYQSTWFLLKYFLRINDDTRMTSIKIVQFLRPPNPLVYLRPKFLHHLEIGRAIWNEPPLPHFLQMITRQLKVNLIKEWLLYVFRSFLHVGFRFHLFRFYQLINLAWLSFDFFSFSWSLTICFFVPLCSFMCSCPKISQIIFIVIHFFRTSFPMNLFYLHNLKK